MNEFEQTFQKFSILRLFSQAVSFVHQGIKLISRLGEKLLHQVVNWGIYHIRLQSIKPIQKTVSRQSSPVGEEQQI